MPEAVLVVLSAFALFVLLGVIGNPVYRVIKIDGGSMAPTIARGDLVVVTSAPARLEPGQIVVMTVDREVVTHRVVATYSDGRFTTRGDANRVNDDWGSQEVRVVGLYVATVPWLGAILPVPSVSAASFADQVTGSMSIMVGSWPAPTPPPVPAECRGMTFAEVLVGTDGPDHITAQNRGALIFGLGGDDILEGGNGKDCIVGGDGNDTLSGGNGKDVLLGGDGDDRLSGGGDDDSIGGGNGKDRLDGGPGTDSCDGGLGKDLLISCESDAAPPAAGAPGSDDAATDPADQPTPEVSTTPAPDDSASPSGAPDTTTPASPDASPSNPSGTPGPPTGVVGTPAPSVTPEATPAPTSEPSPSSTALTSPPAEPTPSESPSTEPTPEASEPPTPGPSEPPTVEPSSPPPAEPTP